MMSTYPTKLQGTGVHTSILIIWSYLIMMCLAIMKLVNFQKLVLLIVKEE